MLQSRQGRERAAKPVRTGPRHTDRGDIVTGLMLAAGTVAIGAFVDIFGLLATWSGAPVAPCSTLAIAGGGRQG